MTTEVEELRLWQQKSPQSRLFSARQAFDFYVKTIAQFKEPAHYLEALHHSLGFLPPAALVASLATIPLPTTPLSQLESKSSSLNQTIHTRLLFLCYALPLAAALLWALVLAYRQPQTALLLALGLLLVASILSTVLARHILKLDAPSSQMSHTITALFFLGILPPFVGLITTSLLPLWVALFYYPLLLLSILWPRHAYRQYQAVQSQLLVTVNGRQLLLQTYEFLPPPPSWPAPLSLLRSTSLPAAQRSLYNQEVRSLNKMITTLPPRQPWVDLASTIEQENALITKWNAHLLGLEK